MGFVKFSVEFDGYSHSSMRNTFRQVTTSPAFPPTSELTASLQSKSFLKLCWLKSFFIKSFYFCLVLLVFINSNKT